MKWIFVNKLKIYGIIKNKIRDKDTILFRLCVKWCIHILEELVNEAMKTKPI